MFNDTTSNQIGVPSGFQRDSGLSGLMLAIAKKRGMTRPQDRTPTSDVAAAFKEGERAPVAGAMPA